MEDKDKTKDQLVADLREMRQRVSELEQSKEEKLKKNLAELNAIINALPGIVSVVDTDFNVMIANNEVYKRFGQGGSQEIIARKCYRTRKGLEQPCPQCGLLAAFKTGETISRVSTPEEEKLMGIATKAYAVPLADENGGIWGGVEVILDITDIRKTEEDLRRNREQMQLALQGADLGLWDWNIISGEVSYNQRWAEMLGYALDEVKPNISSWEKLVHPDDIPGVMKALNRHLDGKTPIYETEHRLLSKDGSWKWILDRGKVLEWDNNGNPLRATGTHLDITERKQAEEERMKLRKLESVGVLAGGIAHDFNNLLTGLFGNMEMAKRFLSTDHKSYKFLESAGRSMEIATNLTKQLLTFARGGDPIKETLSIGEALTETALFSTRGSNAKLRTDIAPDLWPVEADKGQLSQVISNLIINALQAMPGGGIVTLSAENVRTGGGRYVHITVRDQGVGIAPQYFDRIFDPYFTTKQKGSGLGLAVTHSIINKHNGTITVDSTLNQGTTFTIRLPAAEAAENKTPEKGSGEIDSETVPGVEILVLDDEETVREVLGAMLEKMGHRVSFATAGQEAIVKYRNAYNDGPAYDVVIVDLTIPGGMGGEETAQEILRINPRARLVVSSGYATDPVMANFEAHGFRGVLVKPYRFEELKNVVEQVLKS